LRDELVALAGPDQLDQLDQQAVVQPPVLRLTADNRRTDSTRTAGSTRCTIALSRITMTRRGAALTARPMAGMPRPPHDGQPQAAVVAWPSSYKPDSGRKLRITAATKQDPLADKTG